VKLQSFLESLMIQQKDARVVPFRLNWAQQEVLEVVERQMRTTGRVRIIVLKARQLGISTFFQALLFVLSFLTPGYRGLVVAHEIPASQNLLAMTHRYWDTYPFKRLFTLKSMSKNDLSWVETGSAIKIATAGNKALGRSSTIAMESTAEGVGNFFHQQWKLAEDGESEYEPIFLPWWRHPEYLASHINVPHDNLGSLDSEEKILRGMGLSDDRLAWRRWAIKNLCGNDLRKFQQEYPATPEEAFLSSGSNVFPAHSLRDCYKPERGYQGMLVRDGLSVKFVPHEDGPLTVFQAPSKDRDYGKYVVAGDPTHTTRGDFACAQVLNRRTMEQVAVWRGRIDPASFGEELFKLGLYYHEALVVSEIEGPGYSTIGKLLGMEYPNIYRRARPDSTPGKVSGDLHGWSTTVQSKHLAIGWLLKCVVDGSLAIHHPKTYGEMGNYITLENGGYGNADHEAHDDTVMALAIAVTCHILDGPLMAYGSNPGPAVPGSLDPDAWGDLDTYDPEWKP
jgi:hypothetical protein